MIRKEEMEVRVKKLIIILFAAIFLAGCAAIYNPSPEQREKSRKAYEQYQRDKVQRDILKELKKQNRRK